MASPAFRLEVIFDSIQELQQAKALNEKKLNEVRNNRRCLESKLDAVSAKHAQASDTNNKMMETLKIAQHKVSQTQSQIDSQEEANQIISGRIKTLNEKVKQEEERQKNEINAFETKLAELAARFLNARHYYLPDSLRNKIDEISKKQRQLKEQVKENEEEADKLSEQMQQMKIDNDSEIEEYEIPPEVQVETYNMFVESYQLACIKLKELKDEENLLTEEHKRLSALVSPMEVQLSGAQVKETQKIGELRA
ncbi:synaptonemal complex central element protein 1-like [Ptychodera flava]|uniref:synaptonemal complex central element protein 1-like n=1 Tax=Ptychodera flava TaxID=63121 RepID=UPI00396A37BD